MGYRLCDTKAICEPVLAFYYLDNRQQISKEFPWKWKQNIDAGKLILKCRPQNSNVVWHKYLCRHGGLLYSFGSEQFQPMREDVTLVTSSLIGWNLFNQKETSWGLLGPVVYKSYHCVSARNRFPKKLHVFLNNIVLHNIMCETNCTVIKTQFCRLFCEKVTQKTETGLLGPG